MEHLYKRNVSSVKELASRTFDSMPKTVKRGVLGGLVLAGSAAAVQPGANAIGLDDLVNEANATQRTVVLDVDPIIEEITPLAEFRVEQYDLGNDQKGFRIYRDQDRDFNADMSHAEMRTPLPITLNPDTTRVDLLSAMPISAPINKSVGQHTDLNGDPDPIISNQFDYLTYFGHNPYFFTLNDKGTRTIFIDTSNTTPTERQIMQEEIEAYNLPLFNSPTAQVQLYSGVIPGSFAVGDTITWKANVYDDLGVAIGTTDFENEEIKVARDAPDFRSTFRAELGNSMMLSGFDIDSKDKEQLELIDIYAARAKNFSEVKGFGPSYDGVVLFDDQFYPNSSQPGMGWPAELPAQGPESVYWLDSNGTVIFNPDAIGTAAPSIDKFVASLGQNSPNPFNPTTTINYELLTTGPVRIDVYDLRGRHVDTLVDGVMPAGEYVARWDGKDETGDQVSSGTYLYRLQTEQGTTSKKMTLVE